MKKVFIMLAVALGFASSASACISEGPTYNAYLFSVFNRSLMQDRFTDATDRYWQKLFNDSTMSFRWDRKEIMKRLSRRKDTELLTYCRRLNSYIDANIDMNSWDYPTKAQIARRQTMLRSLLQASVAYKGKRLRSQYALMRMRALFGLKRYPQAISYWQTTGSKLPQSVYHDIMRNIYAGCLWRTGKKSQAVDIYAAQEDYVSLKYCVRGYRNLAGIQKVYATNPNSPTLNYLVQDFVNNVQETMDVYQNGNLPGSIVEDPSVLDGWMKDIDAKKITTAEADRFLTFARSIVSSGKTNVPCLWQSAIGCIEHQLGRYDKAKTDLAKAETLAGTPRMKDNARAIYAANSIFAEKRTTDYDKWLTGEMQWLDGKSQEDRNSQTLYAGDHYLDVKERMVYHGLVPRLMASGDTNAALVLLSMINNMGIYTDNGYGGTYFSTLDTIPAKKLIGYAEYLKAQPTDPLESYAWQRSYRDSNYYNDLIGTKYLALGKFAEAIPYLEKVSINFLDKQNIAYFAYYRDYNKERWMGKQKIVLPDNVDNLHSIKLTSNKKLQYCRDMLRMQQEFSLMRPGEERNAKAYLLASMWYQGSYEGDCWWLKQYNLSVAQDSAKVGTLDFVAKAIPLLEESAQSTDFTLKEKSLYALAYIRHGDPWYFMGWDDKTNTYYDIDNLLIRKQSSQYKAMTTLATFYKDNATRVDQFVSKCDILKKFMKTL